MLSEERTLPQLGWSGSEVIVPLARSYVAQGKHKLVLEQAQFQTGGLPPGVQVELLLLRASVQADLGDVRSAFKSIDEARAIDSRSPEVWLAEVPVLDPSGPVTVGNQQFSLVYPILDPLAQGTVDGFQLTSPPGYSGPMPPTASYNPAVASVDLQHTANPAPMPVKWIYILRDGTMDVRQDQTFAPIYLRGRAPAIKAVEVAS